jgi:hypothetical protein
MIFNGRHTFFNVGNRYFHTYVLSPGLRTEGLRFESGQQGHKKSGPHI